jgi:hypothetical protein
MAKTLREKIKKFALTATLIGGLIGGSGCGHYTQSRGGSGTQYTQVGNIRVADSKNYRVGTVVRNGPEEKEMTTPYRTVETFDPETGEWGILGISRDGWQTKTSSIKGKKSIVITPEARALPSEALREYGKELQKNAQDVQERIEKEFE